MTLAVLARRLKAQAGLTREQLQASLRLFKPDTVLGWHRALVRRKWTFTQRHKPGWPSIDEDLERWIVRLAQDNPGLGFKKLEGGLRKLGFEVSKATVRRVQRRHGIPPAPERFGQGSSWRCPGRKLIRSWNGAQDKLVRSNRSPVSKPKEHL